MNGARQLCVRISTCSNGSARVHNSDKSIDFETTLTAAVQKKMKGARVKYFYAIVEGTGMHAKLVEVKASASYQGW